MNAKLKARNLKFRREFRCCGDSHFRLSAMEARIADANRFLNEIRWF